MAGTRKTNGPGKGKVHISTSVPDDLADEIKRLAKSSGLSRGAWARLAILQAVQDGLIQATTPIRTAYEIATMPTAVVAETPSVPFTPQNKDAVAPADGSAPKVIHPPISTTTTQRLQRRAKS